MALLCSDVLTKSSSAGVSESGFQSRPPSRRRGRPACSFAGHAPHERALEAFLEFVFEALELFGGQAAFAGGVDEGTGGAGGVVQQRLVPLGGLVVDVDGRGFDGADSIIAQTYVEDFTITPSIWPMRLTSF